MIGQNAPGADAQAEALMSLDEDALEGGEVAVVAEQVDASGGAVEHVID